jgi:hypothetical protein
MGVNWRYPHHGPLPHTCYEIAVVVWGEGSERFGEHTTRRREFSQTLQSNKVGGLRVLDPDIEQRAQAVADELGRELVLIASGYGENQEDAGDDFVRPAEYELATVTPNGGASGSAA